MSGTHVWSRLCRARLDTCHLPPYLLAAMYFIVIMAFALVLSNDLPPRACLLRWFEPLHGETFGVGVPLYATLAVVAVQLILVAVAAGFTNRVTLARLGSTPESHDKATAAYARGQSVVLGIMAVSLPVTLIFTPWAPLVREVWGLGRVPLLGDLAVLAPFVASLVVSWSIAFRVEQRIKKAALSFAGPEDQPLPAEQRNEATAALAAATRRSAPPDRSLGMFLADKFRHQVLIIAAPMSCIVFAKYFTDRFRHDLARLTTLPWAADSLLGLLSAVVLGLAPLMLRYVWTTEPLPGGALRDRFIRTCRRIKLRYREILLWHTHGTAVNAAVMGFISPLRYILVSDALLETMDEQEIEAVFGHEAGHVRHWHLQFFILFAIVSMYIAGGVMYLLWLCGIRWNVPWLKDSDLLQMGAMAVLLTMWLFGFGWISRRFERQADLYGVKCLTPDIQCNVDRCPVHGVGGGTRPDGGSPQPPRSADELHGPRPAAAGPDSAALCLTAANVFGRTLSRIAELNGIPKEAASWRHGSIADRCRLVERLATDSAARRRFERGIMFIKAGLVVATVIGTVVAAWLYGEQILHAWRAMFRR